MNRARNGWTAFARSLPTHRFHDWSKTEAALQRQRHCSVICQSIFKTKISLERSFPALNEHVLLLWIERETAEQSPLEVCRCIDFAIDRRLRAASDRGRLRLNLNPLNLVRWIDSWPFDKTWKPGWIDSTWVNRFNGRAMNLEWSFIKTASRARKSFSKASPYFFCKDRAGFDGDGFNAVRLFRVISEDSAERDSLDESSVFLIEGAQRHCSVVCRSIFKPKISLERSLPALNDSCFAFVNRTRNGWTASARSLPTHRFRNWLKTEAALKFNLLTGYPKYKRHALHSEHWLGESMKQSAEVENIFFFIFNVVKARKISSFACVD